MCPLPEAITPPPVPTSEPAEPYPLRKQTRRRLLRGLLSLLAILILSVVSYLLVSRFIVTAVVVQGRSMWPTLKDGDRCVLQRWVYLWRTPRRGDLVVLRDPGHEDYAVKRIVGLPNESVQLKQGAVYVNGRPLEEPYLARGTRTFANNRKDQWIQTGKDQYFVLGDNRACSEDSRSYGSVHRGQFIGVLSGTVHPGR